MSATSSAKSAAGKARQRERNRAAGALSRSGSSGVLERIRNVQLMSFEEAEVFGVEHLTDVLVGVQQTQLTADGGALMTMVVPPEWVGRAVDLHRASRSGLVFVRAFVTPMGGDGDAGEPAAE